MGYSISSAGYKSLPSKVQALVDFLKPETICQLLRFLGMLNFYRTSIPHLAEVSAPLYEQIKKVKKKDKTPVVWDDRRESAYVKVKKALVDASLLAFPDRDGKIRVVTDASDLAMGGALEQFDPVVKSWKPLTFYSKKFDSAQQKYSTFDRELTAVVSTIKSFQYYLEGRSFQVCTDHRPLLYTMKQSHEKALARRQRQLEYLSQFDIKFVYLPGQDNSVADALSRIDSLVSPSTLDLSFDSVDNNLGRQSDISEVQTFSFPTLFKCEELSNLQAEDEPLKKILADPSHELKLVKLRLGNSDRYLYCNVQGNIIRPYVPLVLRIKIIKLYHSAAHTSARITYRAVREKYVWPNMSRDVTEFCKTCLACQCSKISRGNKPPLGKFITPDARFQHVHIDLVGPLPESQGFTYLFTMIDRFSRWPEAVPLRDISAKTVVRAFFDNWVSRFGAPLRITTDQGRQFEGGVFREFVSLLGAQHIHTTPYHPAGNGMIERWHRRVKSSLMAAVDRSDWSLALLSVLLGLRVAIVCESDSSPAQMIYGNALRIPGDLCVNNQPIIDRREFHNELRSFMNSVSAVPTRPRDSRKPFVFRDLKNCSHVLRATPKNKASLIPPFTGPHRIIKRQKHLKYFLIDYNGKEITVSADSVKPAFVVQEDVPPSEPPVPVCVERLENVRTSSGGEVPLPSSVLTPTRHDVVDKVPVNVPAALPSPPIAAPAVTGPARRVKFVPNILRRRRVE
uniref:RNA-directed DNA polymerase n=1 Tax=Trichogramma kaykai TaxID=54128 RepID=A0ABD2XQU4_9HYME